MLLLWTLDSRQVWSSWRYLVNVCRIYISKYAVFSISVTLLLGKYQLDDLTDINLQIRSGIAGYVRGGGAIVGFD